MCPNFRLFEGGFEFDQYWRNPGWSLEMMLWFRCWWEDLLGWKTTKSTRRVLGHLLICWLVCSDFKIDSILNCLQDEQWDKLARVTLHSNKCPSGFIKRRNLVYGDGWKWMTDSYIMIDGGKESKTKIVCPTSNHNQRERQKTVTLWWRAEKSLKQRAFAQCPTSIHDQWAS